MQRTILRSIPGNLTGVASLRMGFNASYKRWMGSSANENLIDVSDDDQFKSLLDGSTKSGKLVLVDFTAKWCGPCRMIAPTYERLSSQNPSVLFLKVDIDNEKLGSTVNEHNITGVPTFVYYKNGRRVECFSGARAQMLEDLIVKHK